MAEMKRSELIQELRRMAPETGSLNCLGCGHEHNCSLRGCAVLLAAADALEAQQQQWIPVTKRLPETSQDVLITRRAWGTVRVMKAFYMSSDDGGIWASQCGIDTTGVIAWLPLPEPYQSEEEMCK